MKNYYLAIDIGASSGRHIVGWKENGKLYTDEVYRFENGTEILGDHAIWNIEIIFKEVVNGIHKAFQKYGTLQSLSIDTWGVDYVLMNDDEEIWPCYAYRDNRTEEVINQVHSKISFHELYRHTGCQFQPFNSIYQLYADKKNGRLENATDFLMIPEYLMYRLTGVKCHEYTNATTTGLINAKEGTYDKEILDILGLPEHLFTRPKASGTNLGYLKDDVAEAVGGNCLVVLCATHDTASAVEGIPMEGNEVYLSSGTWSLLGVKTKECLTDEKSETANYSNEGGIGYNRYQKNIMGLWLVQELRKELCPDIGFDTIVEEAMKSTYDGIVDVNSLEFLAPLSMKAAFDAVITKPMKSKWDYFRSAYCSLAINYQTAIQELEQNTNQKYEKLYIVGGGAKNEFLKCMSNKLVKIVI